MDFIFALLFISSCIIDSIACECRCFYDDMQYVAITTFCIFAIMFVVDVIFIYLIVVKDIVNKWMGLFCERMI